MVRASCSATAPGRITLKEGNGSGRPCELARSHKGTDMNELDTMWADFCKSFTWSELLQQFLEGLQHLEKYREGHPQALPPHVKAALEGMRTMGQQLQGIVNDPARFAEPAPPEAVTQILAMVRKVRREVPTIEHPGHA